MPKTTDWDNLALEHNYPNPVDMLSDWYYNKNLSIMQIAIRLGISDTTTRAFMKREGIKVRTDKDRQKAAWSASMGYYTRSDGNRMKIE